LLAYASGLRLAGFRRLARSFEPFAQFLSMGFDLFQFPLPGGRFFVERRHLARQSGRLLGQALGPTALVGGFGKRLAFEPLQASEAVTALLPHAYWSTLADEPRKARMVQTYLELTNTISTYAVTISPVLERLPTLLDELERTVLAPGEGR